MTPCRAAPSVQFEMPTHERHEMRVSGRSKSRVITNFAAEHTHLAWTAMRSNGSEQHQERLFVVERFVSGLDADRLEDLARRERAEVTDLRWSRLHVVYAWSF